MMAILVVLAGGGKEVKEPRLMHVLLLAGKGNSRC
jgi:hypothetical protein